MSKSEIHSIPAGDHFCLATMFDESTEWWQILPGGEHALRAFQIVKKMVITLLNPLRRHPFGASWLYSLTFGHLKSIAI